MMSDCLPFCSSDGAQGVEMRQRVVENATVDGSSGGFDAGGDVDGGSTSRTQDERQNRMPLRVCV